MRPPPPRRRPPAASTLRALRRLILVAVLSLLGSAGPASDARADTRLQPGWLLVAAPNLADPNFRHTVILLVRHGPGGGFGFVLNRPLGSGPMSVLLDGMGVETEQAPSGAVRLFLGGPVEPEQGFVLHSAETGSPSSRPVGGSGLLYSTDAALLGTIADGRGPARYRLFFGYTGWGAGQLEGEVDRGDWRLAPMEPDDAFSEQPRSLWEAVLKRSGVPL